jgi:hypothetical protein
MPSRAALVAAAAAVVAAGAYGGVALVRSAAGDGADPGPRVVAHDTAERRADDALLDAIDTRFSPRVPRTPGPRALREYRTWIADRFGPAHTATPLP